MGMSVGKRIVIKMFALCLLAGCKNGDPLFVKVDAVAAGITFENKLSPTEDLNIIDYIYFYNGGGVAVGDINGDDLPDIFLSGNQVRNRLYLNKGNLTFEDITESAGVAGNSTWNTGSVMGDVNGDGLLDIYVCAVVGLKNLRGHNELYINNGDNTFTERSAEYGLDFESYSSTAAFLDYDLDGDLDIYLLNHAVHTPGSFGHADLRLERTYESGGKLLRNDGDKFVDVSEEANIYGGINGYGLGVAISDFNLDGYPDIYVGNDFHEDDYYYLNNQDGTFSEVGKEAFSCMSKFSMGNDVADINHDGLPDLISLDMLPEDETVLKRSADDETSSILKLRVERYGYHYQYPRNMMQINQGNGKFAETALIGNVAATDWSWSALFADFDHDGHQDLFVSNGIPRRPNDLDYIKYVSSERIVNTIGTTNLVDQEALSLMPSGYARNYIFKGSGQYAFYDKSAEWLPDELTCSTATALADLDNDGDLDIVINNVDDKPGIYVNQTNEKARYLKIKLRQEGPNKFSIGSRVYAYRRGVMQMKEMYTVRGFQASSQPILHFGCDQAEEIDSLIVVWPNGEAQKLTNIATNQTLTILPQGTGTISNTFVPRSAKAMFRKVDGEKIGLDFVHKEDPYTDFDRVKLLPYRQSDRGPATAIGDINNDGKADIYFGGSKHIPGAIFVQSGERFVRTNLPSILNDSIKEDVDAVIADFNGDGRSDLFIATGGADFYGKSGPLLDSYYTGSEQGFVKNEIEGYYENASCVKAIDFDDDGDLDIFVGNQSVSNDFGATPRSYLLRNEDGAFSPVQPELFENLGMVTDAAWHDYNDDGHVDLILVGEWMAPVFLRNRGGVFEKDEIVEEGLCGLWQSITPFDMDGDGKSEYVIGNWGLNSRYRASRKSPMRMYYCDFDGNGTSETVIAIEKGGTYYPLDGLDVLASQITSLRKKYTSYAEFAGKSIDEVFSPDQLNTAVRYEVHQLATGYLKERNGKYHFVELPVEVQLAPVMAQVAHDFDRDGANELLLAGNYFGVQPFHGRFGSFAGAIIKDVNTVWNGNALGLDLMNHSVRHLNMLSVYDKEYLLVTVNNAGVQVYELVK